MILDKNEKDIMLEALATLQIQKSVPEGDAIKVKQLYDIISGADNVATIDDCEDIVYKFQILTDEKSHSLGETMTLQEAMDLYWNRIDITYNNIDYSCWKNDNGEYEIITDNGDNYKKNDPKMLNMKVRLADWCEQDDDNNPIIQAEVVG